MDTLPNEILLHISDTMDIATLNRYSLINKHTNELFNTSSTLKQLADNRILPYSNSLAELLKYSRMTIHDLVGHVYTTSDIRMVKLIPFRSYIISLELDRWLNSDVVISQKLQFVRYLIENSSIILSNKYITYILEHCDMDMINLLCSKDMYNEVLYHAASLNRRDIVDYCLEMGVSILESTIFNCINTKHYDMAMYLHSRGGRFCKYAIINVCQNENTEILQYILDNGIDTGDECMYHSALDGNMVLVRYLTELGFRIDPNDIDTIARYNKVEVIKFLHEQGYDLNNVELKYVAKAGNIEMFKTLHHSGCKIDRTVLNYACRYNTYKIVEYILSTNIPKSETKNAIYNAAAAGHLDLVKYLYEKGCYINKFSINEAIKNGHLDVILYLLPRAKLSKNVVRKHIIPLAKSLEYVYLITVLEDYCKNN